MAMFNKNHTVLSDEMMDILTNLVQSDPLYLECKGKCMDNAPEYLNKLKATLHVQANERVLLYMDEGVLTHGRNGMITTDHGIYYKGLMEMPKFTSWNELMNSPINIYYMNGTPLTLRVKAGFSHKPFCNALGGENGANFWIRIKQAIAEYYHLAA
ncbi:MAG: hypothetical protein IJD39_02985 [Clostridia bacterium]|nr:hypothetical protein [Clostridia bacterium]